MRLSPKVILELPLIFDLYQGLIGESTAKKLFVDEVIQASAQDRVLDIGCGTGAIIPLLPPHVSVVGVDISEAYIKAAKAKYGFRAQFVIGDAADPNCHLGGQFDVAYAYGVFHHLPNNALTRMVRGVMNRLRPGGRFVAADPTLVTGQGTISKFLVRNDRGEFVRSPGELASILAEFNPQIEVRHDTLRIPFAKALTVITKVDP